MIVSITKRTSSFSEVLGNNTSKVLSLNDCNLLLQVLSKKQQNNASQRSAHIETEYKRQKQDKNIEGNETKRNEKKRNHFMTKGKETYRGFSWAIATSQSASTIRRSTAHLSHVCQFAKSRSVTQRYIDDAVVYKCGQACKSCRLLSSVLRGSGDEERGKFALITSSRPNLTSAIQKCLPLSWPCTVTGRNTKDEGVVLEEGFRCGNGDITLHKRNETIRNEGTMWAKVKRRRDWYAFARMALLHATTLTLSVPVQHVEHTTH